MPLTGELTDLSLAELLEFFCNQRKNGLLEVICHYGSGRFYLDSGAIVHAEIGTLSGIEAVHYALGLPGASFTFSASVEAPHQTITQSWQSVVLEGLRLIDEGVTCPSAFPEPEVEVVEAADATDEAVAPTRLPNLIFDELEAMLSDQPGAFDEYVHSAAAFPDDAQDEIEASETAEQPAAINDAGPSPAALPETIANQDTAVASQPDDSMNDPDSLIVPLRELADKRPRSVSPAPKDRGFAVPSFLMDVETSRSVYGPWKLATVLTAIILVLVAIAVPWGWHARNKAARQANEAVQSSSQNTQTDVSGSSPANNGTSDTSEPAKKPAETGSETAPEKNKSN